MDTGSGIGQAASEMMRELQKAQQEMQKLDELPSARLDHPPANNGGVWSADRKTRALSRDVALAQHSGAAARTVTEQDIDVALSKAAGRVYFTMPATADLSAQWTDYFCAAVVVSDPPSNDRSLILTAAHCVYDDEHGVFARNVLYIPNEVDRGMNTDCGDDVIGCWVPVAGVVDLQWTTHETAWGAARDIGYYVTRFSGTHAKPLEVMTGTHPIEFTSPASVILFDVAVCTATPVSADLQDVTGVIVTPETTCE